jgi:hypothetical protein
MSNQFSVGQVWQYKTRPQEPSSLLTIVAIDADLEDGIGNIIHVYVSDVEIPNPQAPNGKTSFIGHLPYTEDALAKSVTELVTTDPALPDFKEGYRLWKEAFDSGEAGAFEVPVSEAIAGVEKSIA